MPLVIHEHQQKYQYIVSEATAWQKSKYSSMVPFWKVLVHILSFIETVPFLQLVPTPLVSTAGFPHLLFFKSI